VIDSTRVGNNRATADSVESRPRSLHLPSAIGALAVQITLRSRRPTPIAIALGFLLALCPLSIHGILPENFTTTPEAVFIGLRCEKGSADQRNDHVLRVLIKPAPDPASIVLFSLARKI
jgi:hypothetical protein